MDTVVAFGSHSHMPCRVAVFAPRALRLALAPVSVRLVSSSPFGSVRIGAERGRTGENGGERARELLHGGVRVDAKGRGCIGGGDEPAPAREDLSELGSAASADPRWMHHELMSPMNSRCETITIAPVPVGEGERYTHLFRIR